jgi:radical SAM protein with 4Fe4S-binding SPASM domain
MEVAHVQYYGWALRNRAALLPTRAQLDAATDTVNRARDELKGRLVIDYVVPDYYATLPKACMGGWGRQFLAVSPTGLALPCHAAESLPGFSFPDLRTTSLQDAWNNSEAFNRFRGTAWMPEPCRGCARKEQDWGGCRCQAFALTGDAANTDPACALSPHHALLDLAVQEAAEPRATSPTARWAAPPPGRRADRTVSPSAGRRSALLGLGGALLAAASPAETPTQIAPGVFVLPGVHEDASPTNGNAIANVGFVVGGSSVAVVDPGGSLAHGQRLRRAVEAATPAADPALGPHPRPPRPRHGRRRLRRPPPGGDRPRPPARSPGAAARRLPAHAGARDGPAAAAGSDALPPTRLVEGRWTSTSAAAAC